jgi:predicted RNA binding protein YcfA (HicA-like mRNA interferase family)
MPRRYRPQEVIGVLEHLGWVLVRIRGSHARLVLPDGRNPVTVPLSQREMKPGTFQSVLQQARMNRRTFEAVAEEIL